MTRFIGALLAAMAVLPGAAVAQPAAPAAAPMTVLSQSSEYRFQLDFHVNDAALAKLLPAGWISNASTQGAAKECARALSASASGRHEQPTWRTSSPGAGAGKSFAGRAAPRRQCGQFDVQAVQRAHTAPRFDPDWRREVVDAWRQDGRALHDGGVYWQTIGPRFETPAEIRMIAPHADLVGMTIASECVIAGELGLEYAAICVVDNLANGLAEGQLSVDEMEADRLINATRLRDGLAAVLPRLGAVGR